jgi:hypothetical protein
MTYLDPPDGHESATYQAAADWFEEPVEYVTDAREMAREEVR